MNHSVYLFGVFTGNYTQYPDDYAKDIFPAIASDMKAPSQITIRREGNLSQYIYTRTLSEKAGQYIGICLSFNDVFYVKLKDLFSLFEESVSSLVIRGKILGFSDEGDTVAVADHLYQEKEEIDRLVSFVHEQVQRLPDHYFRSLPPINYGVSKTVNTVLSLEARETDVANAVRDFHLIRIYKASDFDTVLSSGYASKLKKLSSENKSLNEENDDLKKTIAKLRGQQRNFKWVSLLSIVVVILSLILYFKVINPSEVSKYQTKEFLYYGPIKDKKPNGEGVAFYPANDPDGRRYYIGNFDYGERNDSEAMLYYQSGDYFYGSMTGDKWDEGIFYSTSDDSHFVGSFVNNEPSDGTWYRHEEAYKVRNGKIVKY